MSDRLRFPARRVNPTWYGMNYSTLFVSRGRYAGSERGERWRRRTEERTERKQKTDWVVFSSERSTRNVTVYRPPPLRRHSRGGAFPLIPLFLPGGGGLGIAVVGHWSEIYSQISKISDSRVALDTHVQYNCNHPQWRNNIASFDGCTVQYVVKWNFPSLSLPLNEGWKSRESCYGREEEIN